LWVDTLEVFGIVAMVGRRFENRVEVNRRYSQIDQVRHMTANSLRTPPVG
jgi:hypothetical protein